MRFTTNLAVLRIIILLLSATCMTGCTKLVKVNAPVTSLSSSNVYSTDPTAIAAIDAIYTAISSAGPFTQQLPGVTGIAGLSADELTLSSLTSDPNLLQYYQNGLTSSTTDFWSPIYALIYQANAAIESLNTANTLTPAVKTQLQGESRFCRAFMYFYLVNLYGDVPLILTTDYKTNNLFPRTPKAQVWQQIIDDLHNSEHLLSGNFLDGSLLVTTSERTRPTKWAATALLSRAYLFSGKWDGADSAASVLLSNNLFRLNGLDTVFDKNSEEAIWQLQPVNIGLNTSFAYSFVLPPSGPDGGTWVAYLNEALVQAFEPDDQRRSHWIDSVAVDNVTYYFPFKYKNNVNDPNAVQTPADMTEYNMVLRLSEQYLIRAEARAQLGDLSGSIADIDAVRSRAGLSGTAASTKTDILTAILSERRLELFTEWGMRWFDLKRTGTVDAVMGVGGGCASKGGVWNTNSQLYPLPLGDLKADPNLIQNPGYN